jgi:hypothetical protein
MKVIAAKDFRNTHKFNIPDAVNEFHVHKGAQFEVDEGVPANAAALAVLSWQGQIQSVSDSPDDKAKVAAILKEVTAEKKAAEKAAAATVAAK